MKNFLFITTFLLCSALTAQEKYLTRTGEVLFEASVPSFEEVAAKNNSTTAIINTENGEIAVLAFVKGFRFKNALMEEHFNENYAESEKFPKATFKGTIENFEFSELTSDPKPFTVTGTLEFHGETHILERVDIDLALLADGLSMTGNFIANVSDFKIEIPAVVSNKVSNNVAVSFYFNLKKK